MGVWKAGAEIFTSKRPMNPDRSVAKEKSFIREVLDLSTRVCACLVPRVEAQMVVAALDFLPSVKPQQEVRTKWRLSGSSLMEAE